ncbi:hypothetical protein [Streptomyces griseoaurantiacus]|uniref:hypothetical protein n=1 Tax=Streptomyces griseoaurantiacus TaxID=68213 RepID=UPI002E27CBF2|nr:hypothetical protein [Streptomyces jietaisiensis]
MAVTYAPDREPWQRQPWESARDAELLALYYSLGPDRSHELLLAEWNRRAQLDRRVKPIRSVRTIERASAAGDWVRRVAWREDAEYARVARRYRIRDAEQRATNADLLGRLAERCALLALEANAADMKPADLLRATGDLTKKHFEVTAPRALLNYAGPAAPAADGSASSELLEQDQEHGRHGETLDRMLAEIARDVDARAARSAGAPAGQDDAGPASTSRRRAEGLVAVAELLDDEDQDDDEGGR